MSIVDPGYPRPRIVRTDTLIILRLPSGRWLMLLSPDSVVLRLTDTTSKAGAGVGDEGVWAADALVIAAVMTKSEIARRFIGGCGVPPIIRPIGVE